MFKKLIVAAVAAAATLLPVGAEIQPGTASLLKTIDENGILVTINHEECATSGYNGAYRWLGFQREMRLCPGDVVDAGDHNTVRHETIHAIQHCVNMMRRTSTDTPVIANPDDLMSYANNYLSPAEIQWITENYPRDQWLTEIEAFAGARAYTSSELEVIFREACLAPTDV